MTELTLVSFSCRLPDSKTSAHGNLGRDSFSTPFEYFCDDQLLALYLSQSRTCHVHISCVLPMLDEKHMVPLWAASIFH
jgi:hypothetical protein